MTSIARPDEVPEAFQPAWNAHDRLAGTRLDTLILAVVTRVTPFNPSGVRLI